MVRVAAVITDHDRRQYVGDALRSAIAAGADEVVLVRNFDDPIPGVDLQGVTDLLETDPRIGIKQARGLRSVTSEVVAFLDDDDVWLPEKVGALRTWFERPIVYACHFQVPIDAEGRPVTSSHPEWADKDPSQLRRFSTATFRTKHNTLWPGNCSSTAIRRSWGLDWVPWLERAGWSADTFWFVAATLSGKEIRIDPARLTRLRLHTQNMSQTRGSDAVTFRERHRIMSERFAGATSVMRDMVRSSTTAPPPHLAKFLDQRETVFRFWSALEAGTLGRRDAARAFWNGPKWDRAFASASALATLSPESARRAVYRSSLRRWSTVP